MNRMLHSRFHDFISKKQSNNDGFARLFFSQMRRNRCLIFIVIDIILILSITSCSSVGDVITQNPRNYVYKAEEKINFYDNVQTGECISSLTFVSMFTLLDSSFTIREEDGTDENGNVIYHDVVYEQLVQINYHFKSYAEKATDTVEQMFRVADTEDVWGVNNPSVAYTAIPVEGMDSFFVALKNKSDKVRISVYYSGVLTPNAIAELTKDNALTVFTDVHDDNNGAVDLNCQLEEKDRLINQLNKTLDQQNALNNRLYFVASLFAFVMILKLVVILILIFKRKK